MTSQSLASTKDLTLVGDVEKPFLIRDSPCSEKRQLEPGEPCRSSEIALEEAAAPAPDESKILYGRRLFVAFVAMLLSVLLIALGAFFLI
jgi:hypothetical protein